MKGLNGLGPSCSYVTNKAYVTSPDTLRLSDSEAGNRNSLSNSVSSGPRPGARPIYSARTSNKEQTFQKKKKIFMSSPACADGYDMPAQQREDGDLK